MTMNYKFPIINHIDDVLPAIQDAPEFIVVEKDGYQVINYVVMMEDSFPAVNVVYLADGNEQMCGEYGPAIFETKADYHSALRRECRGLIFDLKGNIINRRYHKFFNVNEREETLEQNIDWSKSHSLLEKLDGSMVSPCMVNGNIRWMTKMGITDTSMQAETFVATRPDYNLMAIALLQINFTPIFEWCSNKNRIVLDYPEDRLVLTAVRSNFTGEYSRYVDITYLGKCYSIPVVKTMTVPEINLLDAVGSMEDAEGIVVRFDDGHMAKVKSDWYVRVHKVKSMLGSERDVLKLILNNELDDLIPVLPKEDVEKIVKFRDELSRTLDIHSETIRLMVESYTKKMSRKEFALNHMDQMLPLWRSLVFKFWDIEVDKPLTYATIVAIILHNCGSNQSYSKVKEAFLKDVNFT